MKPATRFLTLTQTHWLYPAVITLVLVPFVLVVLCYDEIYKSCVRTYTAPGVQGQFGFRMERKRVYYRGMQALDVYVIKDMEPTGVLAKAGLRNNDVPLGLFYGNDVTFYQRLLRTKQEAVEIRVIDCDEYEHWLQTGEFSFHRARKIVIPQQAN